MPGSDDDAGDRLLRTIDALEACDDAGVSLVGAFPRAQVALA
jgi:hypothetical protein